VFWFVSQSIFRITALCWEQACEITDGIGQVVRCMVAFLLHGFPIQSAREMCAKGKEYLIFGQAVRRVAGPEKQVLHHYIFLHPTDNL